MKSLLSLLSLICTTRAVAVLVLLLAPKTGPVLLAFAAVMGLTFLAAVPPAAELVAKLFGTKHMAMRQTAPIAGFGASDQTLSHLSPWRLTAFVPMHQHATSGPAQRAG